MLRQAAFTLVEVSISLALTAMVMVAAAQAISSTRSVEGLQSAEDDLNYDAARIQREMTSDLSQSGWHIVPTGVVSGGVAVSVNTPLSLPSDPVADRAQQYWPYVITQRTAASQFPLMKRSAGMVNLNLPSGLSGSATDATGNVFFLDPANQSAIAASLPSSTNGTRQASVAAIRAGFFKSWYAPSQELIFLKEIGDSGWSTIPSRQNEPTLGFPRTVNGVTVDWSDTSDTMRAQIGVLFPSPYIQTTQGVYGLRTGLTSIYGLPLRATVLDSTDSSKLVFRTAWQTISAPTYNLADLIVPVAAPDNVLRQYVYAVVPPGNSGLGFGRLVRAFKVKFSLLGSTPASGSDRGQLIASDGTYGLMVDDILSEHCVRVVFDTARTDVSLAINEIRARVYLLRRSLVDPTLLVKHVIDLHATMRSRNSYADRTSNDAPIFTPSTGVPGYAY
jgi:type II secretory pathway pseudopilin PulG